MDILIEHLTGQLRELVRLFKLAPTAVSELSKKQNKPTDRELKRWSEFAHTTENKAEHLMIALQDGITEQNKKTIDIELGYFRSLARQMDYVSVHWSAYYSKIRSEMKVMHACLIDIDRKYHLGQHKFEKK